MVVINGILVFAAITFSFALGEAIARVLANVLNMPPIVASDEQTGWRGKAELHNVLKMYGNGQFRISTDSQGHRVSYTGQDTAAAGAPAMLLLGDSFVQGIGVADDETFAYHLARSLPFRIVNLGVAGYGTDQQLLRLEEYFAANPNETIESVVVLVFDNDFVEVQRAQDPFLGRSKPLFKVEDGVLIREPYQLKWSDRLMGIKGVRST